MDISAHRLRPRNWTLRAQLVASMLVLFAVLAMATGAVTVVSLERHLVGQTDDQLHTTLQRMTGAEAGGRGPFPLAPEGGRRRGPGNEGLIAVLSSTSLGTVESRSGSRVELTATQLQALRQAGIGRDPRDLDLGDDIGEYRLMAARRNDATVVVGLPLAPHERTVRNATITAVATGLAGIVLVGLLGTWLIRRNLRALDQVAETATNVATLPLAQGKVALAERVPKDFTDTRTEVGKVGHALNEMLDHIDEALTERHRSEQRVRQFVADASHELRTPLASIKGYAELSRREREPVPPAVTHAIGRIESEAGRMSSLVEDLLLLARLDAGRPLEQHTVDLTQLVIDTVSDAHAASPGHQWMLDLPEEPVEVIGDQARLHQVLANLLANARTHTPEGTAILTGVRRAQDQILVSVHDNGPGVPESLQPNVFQRFARGDSSRSRAAGSTGLGLSIVAAVAQAHGGAVSMSSAPGDTTFTLSLPASTPHS